MAVLDQPTGDVLIAGDIHGDLEAFERAVAVHEETPGSILVFLGDYADRGDRGLEVIERLAGMIDSRVIALKGNHEDYLDGSPTFTPWDLWWEVEEKRGTEWVEFFKWFEENFLNRLVLALLIPGVALCVHGGVCRKIRGLKDLQNPDRETEECVLWSDPLDMPGEYPNPRGVGKLFGPDVTKSVLEALGVKVLIRSHEPAKAARGPFPEHGGLVITTSTTSVYGGRPFLLRIDLSKGLNPQELERHTVFL